MIQNDKFLLNAGDCEGKTLQQILTIMQNELNWY